MKISIAFFSVGIVSVSFFAQLPPAYCLLFPFVLIVCCLYLFPHLKKILYPILFCFVGLSYGTYSGNQALDNRLTENLQEQEVVVRGFITGLPQTEERHQQFQLLVEQAVRASDFRVQEFNSPIKFPKQISVAIFETQAGNQERFLPGDYRQFRIKVKRPRTMVNPQGFDYEVAQMRRGIGASGYVKLGAGNMSKLESDRSLQHPNLLFSHPSVYIDQFRFSLREWLLNNQGIGQASLLTALLIGDTSLIEKMQWKLFNKTGTLHLIAISGLHLGFFAIVGFFFGKSIGRCLCVLWHKCNAYLVGHLFALFFVVGYSLLAGLNIPTLRTLIMLLVMQVAWVIKRNPPGLHVWLVALSAVLMFDPFSAYDKGFWLSFIAVGLLIFYFSGRSMVTDKSRWQNQCSDIMFEFLKSQWLMLVGLLIPLSLLGAQVSLCAPLANLIAIPLVTFFVVPCLILATFFHFISSNVAQFFLHLADAGSDLFQQWLLKMVEWNDSIILNLNHSPNFVFSSCAIPLAILSIFILLLPKGLRSFSLGGIGLVLAFCIPAASIAQLEVLVFDVGQGTAVLVSTPNHQLIYDTGPKYSENFDAGGGIIQPYLQFHGVQKLDALVVSHNDQDHSGGLESLLGAFSVDQLYLGQPDEQSKLAIKPEQVSIKNIQTCHQENKWRWDQVIFEFINYEPVGGKSNNQSCVLLIQYADQKILLTGDIEKPVEHKLLGFEQIKSINVLLAPHHGSHTSSTSEFIKLTNPGYVVYSAGYHNQHGHPHSDVQAAYFEQGSLPLNTAFTGALQFRWLNAESFELNTFRNSHKRYWYWDDINHKRADLLPATLTRE